MSDDNKPSFPNIAIEDDDEVDDQTFGNLN